MNKATPRLFIYTKDIMLITGKSERSASRIMVSIKKKYQKRVNSGITIHEFCEHMRLDEEYVALLLK